ncbi:MAG: hexose kinase [Planctomycetota bacterium]
MPDRVITVTLNPAIDKVLEAKNFAVGDHTPAHRIGSYPAGKGINVARVLGVLGSRCIATGFVGRDELHLFENELERRAAGRVVMQLLVVRGRTRENITIVDPIMDTETHIRDEGFTVQPSDVKRITSKVGMLASPGSIVSIGGSLPPGVSLGDLRTLLHVCHDQGARVIIDTSRSALEALRGEPLWMAKLNAEELATLADQPTDSSETFIEAARSVATRYGGHVDVVVATRGAAGAVLICEEVELIARVFVHPGRIANTVGSGDAMLAGILHQYVQAGDWSASLKLGVATATANAVSRQPGEIDLADIAEFRDAASIDEIKRAPA